MLMPWLKSGDKQPAEARADAVTGLPDRSCFIRGIEEFAKSDNLSSFAVFGVCNIEQFKLINHSYGNAAGDAVLQEVAYRVVSELGEDHLIARIGDDEIGFLVKDKKIDDLQIACKALNQSFSAKLPTHNGKEIPTRLVFGLVQTTPGEAEMDHLFRSTNEAIYSAQYDKYDTICEYKQDDTAIMRRNLNLQNAILVEKWINRDLFFLFIQPIVDVNKREDSHHYEILLRGKNKDGNIVTPEKLISAAEQFNLATKLDKWVIRTLFRWVGDHQSLKSKDYNFSVNISALSINSNELTKYILELTKETGINPKNICFEITERIAIRNMKRCFEFMTQLKKYGFQFALDDFGVGYCSFKYIKVLPFDVIKIDGSFIKDIDKDHSNYTIVKAISDIAKVFNRKTVAEYVETEVTEDIIRKLGIDFGQGYHYAKPFSIDDLTDNSHSEDSGN